jgi:hypothetical protein
MTLNTTGTGTRGQQVATSLSNHLEHRDVGLGHWDDLPVSLTTCTVLSLLMLMINFDLNMDF